MTNDQYKELYYRLNAVGGVPVLPGDAGIGGIRQ